MCTAWWQLWPGLRLWKAKAASSSHGLCHILTVPAAPQTTYLLTTDCTFNIWLLSHFGLWITFLVYFHGPYSMSINYSESHILSKLDTTHFGLSDHSFTNFLWFVSLVTIRFVLRHMKASMMVHFLYLPSTTCLWWLELSTQIAMMNVMCARSDELSPLLSSSNIPRGQLSLHKQRQSMPFAQQRLRSAQLKLNKLLVTLPCY